MAELIKALTDNKGDDIVLSGEETYIVETPLIIPKNTKLIGQVATSGTWDSWWETWAGRPRRLTMLKAHTELDGDIISLSDGATLDSLCISDVERDWKDEAKTVRKQGNVVNVYSEEPNQIITAYIIGCDIFAPNVPSIDEHQLTSRAINVTTWKGSQGSKVTVTVTGCRTTCAAASPGICAVNYSSSSQISVTLTSNHIGGGLDVAAGVSRPDLVTGSTTTIKSNSNLYIGEGPESDTGWSLNGSFNALNPSLNVTGGTTSNTLVVSSIDDVITGFRLSVDAFAGHRPFERTTDDTPLGFVSGNRTEIRMQGTEMHSREADLRFIAATNGGGVQTDHGITAQFKPGDNNHLLVSMTGVTGSAKGHNVFGDSAAVDGTVDANALGSGNKLLFVGWFSDFLANNEGIDPPPAEFFE
jgi:hypothetical protein